MRALVQEPKKTVSTAMSFILVPGFKSMYSSARSAAARSAGSCMLLGSGTVSRSDTPCPGLVPQVTNGSKVSASINTSASKTAS